MTLTGELRECLSELLGASVPSPDDSDDAVRFYRQWLAERNLGLVPIADPASFDWAGKWIAVVDASDGRHAVVMFGSPSGVWLDPARAYEDGVRIVAGWMLTPRTRSSSALVRRATASPSRSARALGPALGVVRRTGDSLVNPSGTPLGAMGLLRPT